MKPIIVIGLLAVLVAGMVWLTPAFASDVTITDNSSMTMVLTSTDLTNLSDGMDALAAALVAAKDAFLLIFEVLIVLGIFAIALWKKTDVIFVLVSGLVLTFAALSWVSTYPQISIPLAGLGLYQVGQGVLLAFGTKPAGGISVLKAAINKVKGIF